MWGVGALAGALAAGWSIAAMGPDGLPFSMAAIFFVFILSIAASRGSARRRPT
jgi:predicted branched-subunit amino acid permease